MYRIEDVTFSTVKESIPLFFFLCFLDDQKAFHSAIRSQQAFEKIKKKYPEQDETISLIQAQAQGLQSFKDFFAQKTQKFSYDFGWMIPKELDLNAWRNFQKNTSMEEICVVIWTSIFGFSSQQVSEALGLSDGTVRYRLSRGLQKIGAGL